MQPLVFPGTWMWSAWQPDRGIFFNSYLFVRGGGNVAVDPLALDEQTTQAITALGGVETIVLTNRDHERAAASLRERFGARVVAAALEAPLFSIAIDATFEDGAEVFEGGFALALDGAKTPGEIALHVPASQIAVVGDALIGAPAGALALPANETLKNAERLVLSLRRLWALELNGLLLGDGTPVLRGADSILGSLLELRGGPDANRINLDEVAWDDDESSPARYRCSDAEIGLLIGARALGYRVARIYPGSAFCPLHEHAIEEEMCYVLEGTPTVRTLRGSIRLRRGDFMAFPTGARGAHQFLNEDREPCTLLILGKNEPIEICRYPDSDKILVGEPDRAVIVRAAPSLDYYDGEA